MKQEIIILSRLHHHCQMFLFLCRVNLQVIKNPIARDVNLFALIHLTATMFIIKDNPSDNKGGFFFRALNKLGLDNLLSPIEITLNQKVGKVTFREYLRQKRNKLVTHGDLTIESQSIEVQELSYNKRYIKQFNKSFSDLEHNVDLLSVKLKKVIEEREHRLTSGSS